MKKLYTQIKVFMSRLISLSDGCVIHMKKISSMFKLACVYRGKKNTIREKNKLKVKKSVSSLKITWLPLVWLDFQMFALVFMIFGLLLWNLLDLMIYMSC